MAWRAAARLIGTASCARFSADKVDDFRHARGLEEFCRRSKWTSAIFADRAGEAGVHRPGLDRLLKHAKLKLIELVIVWKLDTFGRLLGRVILCAPAGLDSDGHSR